MKINSASDLFIELQLVKFLFVSCCYSVQYKLTAVDTFLLLDETLLHLHPSDGHNQLDDYSAALWGLRRGRKNHDRKRKTKIVESKNL